MKSVILWCLLPGLISTICLAVQPEQKVHARAAAIAKAKQWLESNTYARTILDANKKKDLLNPENKVYSNSITVSNDLTEVRFHHNGNPYDSDSITFVVKMGKAHSLVRIDIQITPGGYR